MQTTLKHEKNEALVYIGLGASKALLLYPFWLFKSKGPKSAGAFCRFDTPRGWGIHGGLLGLQVYSYASVAKRPKVGYAAAAAPPTTPYPGVAIKVYSLPVETSVDGTQSYVEPNTGERVVRPQDPPSAV